MKQLSWDSFAKRIYIKGDIHELFRLWTTEKGITSWFLRQADYMRDGKKIDANERIQPGDAYTWQWHNWDGKEEGVILEIKENELVRFSFAGENEVLVTFEPKEQAVLISLTQSKIPQDEKSKLEIFMAVATVGHSGWPT